MHLTLLLEFVVKNFKTSKFSKYNFFLNQDKSNKKIKTLISGSTFRLSIDANKFPTPVGRSFSCSESVVELGPDPDSVQLPGLSGTLFLRELQVQPFMYKSAQFSTEFGCETSGRIRDETAPIAVGSTLAIAVLGMVSGYGAWRYFKVKKVQYNTME